MKNFISFVLLLAFAFGTLAQQKVDKRTLTTNKYSQKECSVSGEVWYPSGVIPHIKITFSSQRNEYKVVTNDDGFYSIKLPTDIYEVTLQMGVNSLSYIRSKINVSCESDLRINLYPQPERISYGDESPQHKFKRMPDEWIPDKRLMLIISYLSKEENKNTVTYNDAWVTYNNLTVSASKLIQDSKNKLITAKGNVWIEDGKSRTNYETLTLKFSTKGVEIEGMKSKSPKSYLN